MSSYTNETGAIFNVDLMARTFPFQPQGAHLAIWTKQVHKKHGAGSCKLSDEYSQIGAGFMLVLLIQWKKCERLSEYWLINEIEVA